MELQQYLPFTVLKPGSVFSKWIKKQINLVATVPTVYGIETFILKSIYDCNAINTLQQYLPFTVLKRINLSKSFNNSSGVATVPTVYGIETSQHQSYD